MYNTIYCGLGVEIIAAFIFLLGGLFLMLSETVWNHFAKEGGGSHKSLANKAIWDKVYE